MVQKPPERAESFLVVGTMPTVSIDDERQFETLLWARSEIVRARPEKGELRSKRGSKMCLIVYETECTHNLDLS